MSLKETVYSLSIAVVCIEANDIWCLEKYSRNGDFSCLFVLWSLEKGYWLMFYLEGFFFMFIRIMKPWKGLLVNVLLGLVKINNRNLLSRMSKAQVHGDYTKEI